MPREVDAGEAQHDDHGENAREEPGKCIGHIGAREEEAKKEGAQQAAIRERGDLESKFHDGILGVGEKHRPADQEDAPEEREGARPPEFTAGIQALAMTGQLEQVQVR